MRQFNEAEHAREERRKYQKTAQTLTLFIISHIVQWLPSITYFIWSSITSPPDVSVSELFGTFNNKAFQLKDKCPLANGCFRLCFSLSLHTTWRPTLLPYIIPHTLPPLPCQIGPFFHMNLLKAVHYRSPPPNREPTHCQINMTQNITVPLTIYSGDNESF